MNPALMTPLAVRFAGATAPTDQRLHAWTSPGGNFSGSRRARQKSPWTHATEDNLDGGFVIETVYIEDDCRDFTGLPDGQTIAAGECLALVTDEDSTTLTDHRIWTADIASIRLRLAYRIGTNPAVQYCEYSLSNRYQRTDNEEWRFIFRPETLHDNFADHAALRAAIGTGHQAAGNSWIINIVQIGD